MLVPDIDLAYHVRKLRIDYQEVVPMQRFISVTIICLLCAAIGEAQGPQLADPQNSTVQIVTIGADGRSEIAQGSGFFVSSDGKIVTAGHVYWQAGGNANETRMPGVYVRKVSDLNKKFLVLSEILNTDPKRDLVLLRVDTRRIKDQWSDFEIKALSISSQDPILGEDVALLGYFESNPFVIMLRGYVAGRIVGLFPPLPLLDELLISVNPNSGFSGGPVVSMKSGQVVGVMSGKLVAVTGPGQAEIASGVSRVVRPQYVQDLIK
jgi:S1-C subfamily serine protease